MTNKILTFALASAVAMIASTASAQWYVGGQGGAARGGPDGGRISEQFVNDLGFFTAETSTDTSDGGWRAFVGYQVNPWLAVEGAYLDLGKSKWSTTVTPPGTFDASLRTRAWTLGLAARYPVTSAFSVYGRISAAWAETKGTFSSTGFVELANDSRTDRRTVPAYAAGVEFAFTPRFAARLEFERLSRVSSDEQGGKFDADFVSLGLRYNF